MDRSVVFTFLTRSRTGAEFQFQATLIHDQTGLTSLRAIVETLVRTQHSHLELIEDADHMTAAEITRILRTSQWPPESKPLFLRFHEYPTDDRIGWFSEFVADGIETLTL